MFSLPTERPNLHSQELNKATHLLEGAMALNMVLLCGMGIGAVTTSNTKLQKFYINGIYLTGGLSVLLPFLYLAFNQEV